MRIGIFGGTFDPPHLGHLILAEEAYYQLELDRLLWILTPIPPHKLGNTITPTVTRLQLVEKAISGNSAFELSSVDLDRPGPHYAVETVRILRNDFPGAEMAYLIGGDSLHDLPTWHLPHELVEEVDLFGVMRRPGDEIDLTQLEQCLPGLRSKVHFIDAPLLEISASQIRQRIHEGRPYRYYLPEKVYQLVKELRLYQE